MKNEDTINRIQEDYLLWKENVPYMYDLMCTQVLTWPSLSVQWFTGCTETLRSKSQKLLLTTFTSKAEEECLLLADFYFPNSSIDHFSNTKNFVFSPSARIPTILDINRARYCPMAHNIIACKTDSPDVLIFNSDNISKNTLGETYNEKLSGHSDGGYAVDWNNERFGELVSGSRDGLIMIFDINSDAVNKRKAHTDIVNDLSYSKSTPHVFASVSDDKSLIIHDTRLETYTKLPNAHKGTIESVSFSPFRPELVATGGSDKALKIWDIRNPSDALYSLTGHFDSILTCKWSPHYESVLCSSSQDRRVNIWDLNRNNTPLSPKSSRELMFVHAGHTDTVDDVDWNPMEPMELASVASDNSLHIWKVSIDNFV